MIKKVLLIFVLGLSLQLITGCDICKCTPSKDINFTRSSLSLQNLDATLPHPYYTKDSVISSTKYGIQLRLNAIILASRPIPRSFGFIQTAQACSCPEPLFVAKEDVLAIEIFSTNDFNSSHPKNTDLSSFFKLKLSANNLLTIDSYFQYLKKFPSKNYSAFFEGLYLQNAPEQSKKHKFRVRVTLSDGRILAAETAEVELT